MDNKKDLLLEPTKNVSYFDKALEWYCYRHLYVAIERFQLLIAVLFLIICMCFLLLNIFVLFPANRVSNFVRYVDHSDGEFSIVHKLNKTKHKKNEYALIADYLLQKYVMLYESYSPAENLSYQDNFIKNNSVHRIYENFQQKISNDYRTLKKVTNVNVTKIFIDQFHDSLVTVLGTAVIDSTVKERNNKTTNYTIQVKFSLSNLQMSLKGVVPFKFTIIDYQYIQ